MNPQLETNLRSLRLNFIHQNFDALMQQALDNKLDKLDFLEFLIQAEADEKTQRAIDRRIKAARIPVQKRLEDFNFAHPQKIDSDRVRYLFRMDFLRQNKNVILCGNVGLGKTHLASALALKACQEGFTALFSSAVQIVNELDIARRQDRLVRQLRKFSKVDLLVIDELGYMPIDKIGCDLLFQVISARYETGSTVITTNRAYKDWPIIFNNDSVVTSAVLDRLLHHAETIVVEGPSYRMKDH
jgi:DNA replication protein DnaC